jgi:hypothetical protein
MILLYCEGSKYERLPNGLERKNQIDLEPGKAWLMIWVSIYRATRNCAAELNVFMSRAAHVSCTAVCCLYGARL